MIILLHKHPVYDLLVVDSDDSGRMVTAHLKFQNKEFLITNIYAPNSLSAALFQEASRCILKKKYPYLIGGDFNTVLRNKKDRSSIGLSSSRDTVARPSLQFTQGASLIDPWHLSLATDKEYTLYSSTHKSFARLDYFFSTTRQRNHYPRNG